MKKKKRLLRRATLNDCKFVYKIRNKKYVRNVSWNAKKLSYKKHKEWFRNNYQYYFIIDNNKGFVRVKNKEVSIAILKKYQNQGLGQQVLDEIAKYYPDLKAEIRLNNPVSLHCFLNAGFRPVGLLLEKETSESKKDAFVPLNEDILDTSKKIIYTNSILKKLKSILVR